MVDESWAATAYSIVAKGSAMPLAIDLSIASSGLDLPDAALEKLCDVIMGDVDQALAPSLVHEQGIRTP